MAEFLDVALAFPTLPYSIVLCFSVIYWLLAATGIVDEGGLGSGDGGDFHSSHDGVSGISAMFARLGLGGAPTMLVVLLLAFFGWTITYFVHLMFLQPLSAPLRWCIGAAVAVAALVPGAAISAWVLRPIRRLLLRLRPVMQESILGKTGIVASPDVTAERGYARVDDGGAGLVLQVRAQAGASYARNDRVRLIDYEKTQNHYLVVADAAYPVLDVLPPHVSGKKEIY